MTTNEIDRLQQRAQSGVVTAQLDLATWHERAGRHEHARAWYARAAQQGDLDGLLKLGASLLCRAPQDPGAGIAMIRDAADKGHAEALHLCAVLAAQDTNLPGNWGIALDYLLRAAEQGSQAAQQQLRLLADAGDGADWRQLRSRIDIARLLAVPPPHVISADPQLDIFDAFLPPAFCEWLKRRSEGKLERARVYDPATAESFVENHRTNSVANFDIGDWDLVFVLARTRASRLAGLPVQCIENPMLLHYAVGQQFTPHYDFLDPDVPALRSEAEAKGQRVATFLVYLNEGYGGGETEFPHLNFRYAAKTGSAMLFRNADANGNPDRRMLHAGLPLIEGEKWVLSQWIRQDRRQQPSQMPLAPSASKG